jgi:hypothetical protein
VLKRVSESNLQIGPFQFESRETYDQAKKEYEMITMLEDKVDLSDPKAALKVYNRFVAEHTFRTAVGYTFLVELHQYIVDSELVTDEGLLSIPVAEMQKRELDTIPSRPNGESRYKRLYERQKTISTKFKFALIAACVLLVGFVVITMKTRYSVFTYFTNYKQNMEEQLIDKYEKWQTDLESRENALKQ